MLWKKNRFLTRGGALNMKRKNIVNQADIELAKALDRIDLLVEHHKNQIRTKNSKLDQLPLDVIPTYIQEMTEEFQYINQSNESFLRVVAELPTINVEDPYQSQFLDYHSF